MDPDNEEFYNIVETIVNNKQARKVIYRMSETELADMTCYLNNRFFCQLKNLIDKISKQILEQNIIISTENVMDSLINYHKICTNKDIPISDILSMSKIVLMKAGARKISAKKEVENELLKKLTLSTESILNRTVDKQLIDHNLRTGALERKIALAKKTGASVSATIEESEIQTIESYNEPRKIIVPKTKIFDPLKKPLSEPLDIPPVTIPPSSIIRTTAETPA